MADEAGPAKQLSLFQDSPFAAPSWPAPQGSDGEDSDDDFFSRSKHTYAQLAADEEERRKRKREGSQNGAPGPSKAPAPSKKKARSSPDAEERKDAGPSSHPAVSEHRALTPITTSPVPQALPRDDSAGASHDDFPEASGSTAAPVIDIESSDDDDVVVTSFQASQPASQPAAAGSSSSDPKAARASPEPSEHLQTTDPTSLDDEDDDLVELPPPSPLAAARPVTSAAMPAPPRNPHEDEPKVSVLITSSIPGTTPLIVQRKLGQRLKEVRLEWCSRQEFAPEVAAQVVLTWRGKRVYDSTSCRALGIGTDGAGNVVGDGEKDLFGIEDRRVYMEAMTEEMLLKAKMARLNPKKTHDEPAAAPPEKKDEPRTRLILRSGGLEELKLLVKPSFLVSRLLSEFRERRAVDESKQVSIRFDGEELSPESSVADCDIDDMDTLDVYVR